MMFVVVIIIILLIDRGFSSRDGSTHQGVFDIAYLSHLPNMVVTAPKDLKEACLIKFALKHSGPIAIRYPSFKQKY